MYCILHLGQGPGLAAPAVGLASLSTAGVAPADLIERQKDETLGVAAEGFWEQETTNGSNSDGAPHVGQALLVIEGEAEAAQFLARIRTSHIAPDELAVTVAALSGPALRGFCRALTKALEVQHEPS
jgi:hypothetical protein